MQTGVIRDIDSIGLSEDDWTRLASASQTNTIFQTYRWFRTWWSVFGSAYRLFFITVTDGDRIIGFAPLMIGQDAGNGRTLRFIGDSHADYMDFILAEQKEAVLPAIISTICAHEHEWDSFYLHNIPARSSTPDVLRRMCRGAGFRMVGHDSSRSHALVIQGNEDVAQRIMRKKTMRRRLNHFRKSGDLRFLQVNDTTAAARYLSVFFDQHIKRRSITSQPSLFLHEKNRQFYTELAAAFIEKGWLLFSVLEMDGNPIAFHYGFCYDSTLVWYKPSFDISLAKHSPGKVMIRHLIEHALSSGLKEIDYTVGEDDFKDAFSNSHRRCWRMIVFGRSNRQYLEYLRHRIVYFAKKIVQVAGRKRT